MSIWNAILLGIVQGFAEFMPVSGSGHIALLQHLFGIQTNGDYYFFQALLHAGTLIAILYVFRVELKSIRIQLRENRMQQYRNEPVKRYPKVRLVVLVGIGCIPMILAVPFYTMFSTLASKTAFVAVTLILNGGLIWVTELMSEGDYTESNLPVVKALIIGLCQFAAIIPGISRVSSAYGSAVACGLKREKALRFTYFLSIPALIGIVVTDLIVAISRGVTIAEVPGALFGMVMAILAGVLSLRLMRSVLKLNQMGNFAYYCWVMGAVALILTFIF